MKICMLVTNTIKKDPRVRREAESASRISGTDVVVIGCNDPNYDEVFCDNQIYKIRIYNLPVKYKKKLNSRVDKAKRMVYPIIGMYRLCVEEKPDIVHANDFDTLPIAILAKKKIGCKVVYDSHEIYTEQPSLIKYPLIKKILKIAERKLIRMADEVVSVSRAASDELARMYKIESPIVVTNCSKYYSKEELLPKNDCFEIIYHGMININRGYEEFALAGEFVDEGVEIVIRGFGDNVDRIRALLTDRGIDNVRIDDPVEIPELVPYASKSMIGAVLTKPVSANYKYTVSNKIFEYIQARLPVIMSDVPEHRYLNEKYGIGLIINEVNPVEISNAINSIYRDKQLYARLYRQVDRAAKQLCWEREFIKLENIYVSLCSMEKK